VLAMAPPPRQTGFYPASGACRIVKRLGCNRVPPLAIVMTAYFTNADGLGRVRYQQLPSSIGITESLESDLPIGIASQVSRNDRGMAVWILRVRGADVPGRWAIVNRKFVHERVET
jgi:hypothetical protein